MKEADLRTEVGSALSKMHPKAHLSWIESPVTSAGFPDLDCCVEGRVVQIELKVVKKGGGIEIRPTQYRWFKDRAKAGGQPVMLIGDDDCYYVLPAVSVSEPDGIFNIVHLAGRPHYRSSTIEYALDAALLISIHGSIVCPIK